MDHEVGETALRLRSRGIVAECVVPHGDPAGSRRARGTERLRAHRLTVEASGCLRERRCCAGGSSGVEIGRAEEPDGPTLGKRAFEDANRLRPDERDAPCGGAGSDERGVGV